MTAGMQIDSIVTVQRCQDCDSEVEEALLTDESQCYSCSKIVCWRCSLRNAEMDNLLICLNCASLRERIR